MSYCDDCGEKIGANCHACGSTLCESCTETCDDCDHDFCRDCLTDGLCEKCAKADAAKKVPGVKTDNACVTCGEDARFRVANGQLTGEPLRCVRCGDPYCAEHLTFEPYGRVCAGCKAEHDDVFRPKLRLVVAHA